VTNPCHACSVNTALPQALRCCGCIWLDTADCVQAVGSGCDEAWDAVAFVGKTSVSQQLLCDSLFANQHTGTPATADAEPASRTTQHAAIVAGLATAHSPLPANHCLAATVRSPTVLLEHGQQRWVTKLACRHSSRQTHTFDLIVRVFSVGRVVGSRWQADKRPCPLKCVHCLCGCATQRCHSAGRGLVRQGRVVGCIRYRLCTWLAATVLAATSSCNVARARYNIIRPQGVTLTWAQQPAYQEGHTQQHADASSDQVCNAQEGVVAAQPVCGAQHNDLLAVELVRVPPGAAAATRRQSQLKQCPIGFSRGGTSPARALQAVRYTQLLNYGHVLDWRMGFGGGWRAGASLMCHPDDGCNSAAVEVPPLRSVLYEVD
jgi:hypothetical protein